MLPRRGRKLEAFRLSMRIRILASPPSRKTVPVARARGKTLREECPAGRDFMRGGRELCDSVPSIDQF